MKINIFWMKFRHLFYWLSALVDDVKLRDLFILFLNFSLEHKLERRMKHPKLNIRTKGHIDAVDSMPYQQMH